MSKHIVFIELSMTGAGEKAVEYANSQGYEITLVTRNPDKYVSATLGTVNVFSCETNDNDELIAAIRKLDQEKKVDGITTTADFYVPQAAIAAETLGLPFMSYEAAAGVRNKYRMRLNLQEHCPHLNPPFRLVKTVEEAVQTATEWGYPLIAKPQDANDSLNVKRIESEIELQQYMEDSKSWRFNGAGQQQAEGVLLEGFIDGEEYSVETLQYKGGLIQKIGVTGKVMAGIDRGYFVEVGVLFPISSPEAEHIFQEVSLALEKLNIDCGVIHTECRIKNNQVKILEINPRLMGDMAGSHMIEVALGASPIQQLVEIALGNPVPWKPTKQEGGAMFGVLMPQSGIFNGIENLDDVKNMPGVAALKVIAKEGNQYLSPPESNEDVLVRLVTGGRSPEEALELAKQAATAAKVKISAK